MSGDMDTAASAAKPSPRPWLYVVAAVVASFFGALLDMTIWGGGYTMTKIGLVGALILPVFVYLGGRARTVRQAAAEHDAVQAEEAYRQRIVEERRARVAAEGGRP